MAPEPRDRYVGTAALAADLECWLADEPVTAYRETAIGGLATLAPTTSWFSGTAAVAVIAVAAIAMLAALSSIGSPARNDR